MITIRLNGRPHDVPEGTTIADLLDDLDLPLPRVAILLNEEVVPRARHHAVVLAVGDAVEVITLAGGG